MDKCVGRLIDTIFEAIGSFLGTIKKSHHLSLSYWEFEEREKGENINLNKCNMISG